MRQHSSDTLVLKQFENVQSQIVTDEYGGTVYNVYRKRFSKNDTVSLQMNTDRIICMLPVSNMPPAYDLKPVKAYKTDVAITENGVTKENYNGRLCAIIKGNSNSDIQWPVQTGVADRYSITMKYHYEGKISKGIIQLIDAGGNRMLEKQVEFTFTREGKWNQFTVTTDNMINAGNYLVKLLITDGKELAVSGIEIQ
ncbi:MAG: hypothetical protein JSU05_09065 [Bacteroidetes bacterium]|nr:hypothetical protein [Bacteroidota bacterium]